jgi:1-acyl-sn-glycerol-3-phosphate acyltransferase
MSKFVLWFVKITGWLPALLYFRKKVIYEDNEKIKHKGPALLVSNHKALMDYPLYMYLYPFKTIRTLTAEVIYKKGKLMAWFIKKIGCIKVDRLSYDFGFMDQSVEALNKKDSVLIFPEHRLPDDDNMRDFKPSFVYIALESKAPIIPLYTDGKYGKKGPAHVVVGKEIYLDKMYM